MNEDVLLGAEVNKSFYGIPVVMDGLCPAKSTLASRASELAESQVSSGQNGTSS